MWSSGGFQIAGMMLFLHDTHGLVLCLQLPTASYNYLQTATTTYSEIQPPTATYNELQLPTASYSYLQLHALPVQLLGRFPAVDFSRHTQVESHLEAQLVKIL